MLNKPLFVAKMLVTIEIQDLEKCPIFGIIDDSTFAQMFLTFN